MSNLLAFIKHSDSPYEVVVEDDGRVAYAYLRDGTSIISDVWLYNSGPTPDQPPWSSADNMPFANPRSYVQEQRPPHLESADDVSAEWHIAKGVVQSVDIYLKGELFARLSPGAKPGWSKLARRKGPLAQPLG